MYVARFSYDVLPINRQRAIEFIRRELSAAQKRKLNARLLVPVTRGHQAPALQFEIQLNSLDELDRFRSDGVGDDKATSDWMHAFSEILTAPPTVEVLKVDDRGGEPR